MDLTLDQSKLLFRRGVQNTGFVNNWIVRHCTEAVYTKFRDIIKYTTLYQCNTLNNNRTPPSGTIILCMSKPHEILPDGVS